MARGRWNSRTTFLLAAIGSAVGLGNVWRFPYLAYEFGGGAFLVPYLLALFVIGIPLLMAEFAIGQKFQSGAVETFKKMGRRWGGLGKFMLISAFLIISYYGVVMAWSLLYFFESFTVSWAGQAEGFFYNNVLALSSGVGSLGGIVWPILLALVAVWILIYFSIWKGVRSVGKIVWWTVPLPILLLVVLFIRGVTLPGAMDGILVYLSPDWSALLSPKIWAAAASQIFFTLSLAFGVLLAYASFNDERENVRGDAYIMAFTNTGISIFAGFVVFSILGYMASETGRVVTDVVESGPGLAFVVFPEALSLLPASWFFALLFFITLLTLGIDSAFSIVEGISTALQDRYKKVRVEKIALLVCGLGFAAGIIFTTNAGLYLLDIVDHFVSNFNLLIAGMLQAFVVGWVYGADKIRHFISDVSGKKLGKAWDIAIRYVTPIVLLALLVNQFVADIRTPYGDYPMWALSIGWAVVVVPLIVLLVDFFRSPGKSSS